MLQIVNSNNPPLRLLLGEDGIGLFEKKQLSFWDEFARWRYISENAAFDGVTTSPVGG